METKRLHLRINTQLLEELNKAARKEGITKNKLISRWLNTPITHGLIVSGCQDTASNKSSKSPEVIKSGTFKSNQKQISEQNPLLGAKSETKVVQTTLRAKTAQLELLHNLSLKWQISLNQLLVRIIRTRLNQSETTQTEQIREPEMQGIADTIHKLWGLGELDRILETFSGNRLLSPEIEIILGRISLQQSQFKLARDLFESAEEKLICQDILESPQFADLTIGKAQWWRMQREYSAADRTLNHLVQNHRGLDDTRYQKILYQLSTLAEIHGNFNQSAEYMLKTFEREIPSKRNTETIKSFLRLASLYSAESVDLTKQYLQKAFDLISKENLSPVMEAHVNNRLGLTYLRLAEIDLAIDYFKKALNISKSFNIKLEYCYSLEGLLACYSSDSLINEAQNAFKNDFNHRTKLQSLIRHRQQKSSGIVQASIPKSIVERLKHYQLYYKRQVFAI